MSSQAVYEGAAGRPQKWTEKRTGETSACHLPHSLSCFSPETTPGHNSWVRGQALITCKYSGQTPEGLSQGFLDQGEFLNQSIVTDLRLGLRQAMPPNMEAECGLGMPAEGFMSWGGRRAWGQVSKREKLEREVCLLCHFVGKGYNVQIKHSHSLLWNQQDFGTEQRNRHIDSLLVLCN